MTIAEKQIHDLVNITSRQWITSEQIRTVLDRAGIDQSRINLNGSSRMIWSNVIRHINQTNQIMALMEALVTLLDNNDELKNIKAEIAGHSLAAKIDHLRTEIRNHHCVLFLGPDFLKCSIDDKNIPFNKYLSAQLAGVLEHHDIFYDKEETENLSYIIDRYETRELFAVGDTEKQAHVIYNDSDKNDNFYREVMRLRFPLIINTNPDIILNKLFPNDCISGYYDMSNTDITFNLEAVEGKTIVYNIFGSFTNPLSILFTEKEAVDFTKNVYEKNPSIPEEIRDIIRNKYGVFVGFDFKEWHLKILFDVLDLRNKPGNYAFTDTSSVILERNREYYQRRYNMTFIKNDVFKLFRILNEQ